METSLERPVPVLTCSEIGKLHSLAFAGIPVYAGSNYKQNTALYSRFVKERIYFPDYETKEFIQALTTFGEKQSQKIVLMTDDDQAALAISRHREKLKDHFLFLLPDPETVEAIQDKQKFYKKAAALGLKIPGTVTISSAEELHERKDELSFPCIIKPINKEDWWDEEYQKITKSKKKALRCSTYNELLDTYNNIKQFNDRVIIQELIDGPDDQHYSVNMYIDREDRVKGYYLYQKVRMCPPKAGRGSYMVTVEDPEVAQEAHQVAQTLDLRGLINIQFKRDQAGDIKLIEIEPRLSVSSFLGAAAGANLAEQYYLDIIGKDTPSNKSYKPNVKYFDLIRDLKASYQYWQQGELSLGDWMRSYQGKRVCNGYSWKDPFPVVMSVWFMISSKLKKLAWRN